MKGSLPVALGLIFILALILRVPELDQRPFHNDEAVNALKFQGLYEAGEHRYDPHEYHGPLLHYATLGLARVTGWGSFTVTTEASFRWVTVLAGVSLIPLLWFVRDALGRMGTINAALFTAISPSLTFYSRDYIHESLLVTGVLLLVGCLWRYGRQPHWKWALLSGVALAVMHTTKETFVLNLAAMLAAFVVLRIVSGCEATGTHPCLPGRPRDYALGLGLWLVLAAALFTSFGSNPVGLLDSVRTYFPWISRAGEESPHAHPFWWFAQRLFWQDSGNLVPWTELGLLVLALIGSAAAVLRRGMGETSIPFVRWLALYTLLLFVVYSCIPYKTPWCILSVTQGMAILAGVGLAVVWRVVWRPRFRIVLAFATAILLGQLTWQAWALSYSQVFARENPWAYADTTPDIRNLVQRVEELSASSPAGRAMRIDVVCDEDDYWPLPYYLRSYNQVGWWSELSDAPMAPVIIGSPAIGKALETRNDYVNTGTYQLRYGVFLTCWVKHTLWDEFLRSRGSD